MLAPSPTRHPRGPEVNALTHHLAHSLMLGLPLYAFALFFAAEWRRTAGSVLPWSLRLAVLGSAGAGIVHGIATPHHVHESALLGWFFALLCVAQLAWVVAVLVVPRRHVVALGVVANLGVVALWAWTAAPASGSRPGTWPRPPSRSSSCWVVWPGSTPPATHLPHAEQP